VRQDHRQHVEVPRPVGAVRIGMNVVGDAVLAHLALHRLQAIAHQLGRRRDQLIDDLAPVRARRQRRLEHLVVAGGGRRVGVEQLSRHARSG